MKKIIILLLTASMIAAAFTGCTEPAFGSSSADTNGNGLRDDVELEIIEYYYKENKIQGKLAVKDFQLQYYGTYNGAVAFRIWHKGTPYTAWTYKETVGEVEFTYGRNNKIKIWHNGAFYTLQEMYDQGVLTNDNLTAINAEYVEQPEHKLTWE